MATALQNVSPPNLRAIPAGLTLGRVDLTNDQYHSGPGISKSHLDVIARSGLHYWQAYRNPEREPRVATPAFLTGTVIHAAILEPDVFQSEFIVVPEHAPSRPTVRQLNAAKPSPETVQAIAWWQWFDEENKGKTIVSPEDMKIALGVRDAVFRHPAAARLLSRGKPEQSYFAIDPDTGALVKCRTDWDALEHGYILDVKSTVSAAPKDFMRSVLDYRYYVQEPFYKGVIESALDAPIPKDWYFLAAEKAPPHACAVYTLPPDMVAAGRAAAAADLWTIMDCNDRNVWPAYSTEPEELVFPGWARRQAGADSPEVDYA